MSTPPSVVVVGAGIAGLAAAVRLKASGAEVRVLAPEPPGGKARTHVKGDWRFEHGPHSFTHRSDALFALAGELRIADRVVKLGEAASARYLVRGGKLKKLGPFAFGPGELFDIARGLFRDVGVPDGETVRGFLAARFGEGFADGPGDAMCTGIWASSPAELEMETAFPAIVAGVRAHGSLWAAVRRMPKASRPTGTYALRGGMGAFGEGAAQVLGERAIVSCAVERVTREGRGWLVDTSGGQVRADGLVLATNAVRSAELLAELAPAAAERLRTIRYAPIAVAHWTSPDAAWPRGFGWLSPFAEGRAALGTLFTSDVLEGRAPAGMRSFATMFGGTRRPDDVTLDAQAIAGRVRADHEALTGKPVTIAEIEVVRHAQAVPVPEPGHLARVAAIHAATPEGMALAGAWCGAGAMEDAARAGQVAAASLRRLSTPGRIHAA